MGTISRLRAGELVVKLFANKVEDHFKPILVDKIIESRGKINVDYFIETNIKIDNEEYLMHYRWASEEESDKGAEIPEEGVITLADYFDQSVKGQKIKRVTFGFTDREDELYLVCVLENDFMVDIPMGFSTEGAVFYGYLREILNEEEIECYRILRRINRAVRRYNTNRQVSFEEKVKIYREMLCALEIKEEVEYEISDFYKIPKIKQIVEGDIKNVTETVASIERAIYQ